LFRKYDRHQNGFLEINEYVQCLREGNLGLTEQEIISLSISADINGDGRIDYEEFMKHFTDMLRMVRIQNSLQEAYNLYKSQGNTPMGFSPGHRQMFPKESSAGVGGGFELKKEDEH